METSWHTLCHSSRTAPSPPWCRCGRDHSPLLYDLGEMYLGRQALSSVQTPQHFYNVCHAGDIFNHQNLLFFQAVQVNLP